MENDQSVAEKQAGKIADILKTINLSTFIGSGLLVVFLILCLFAATALRWWLMIPIILSAGICFEVGRQRFTGLEKKICMIGLAVAVCLALVRDAVISHKMVGVRELFIEAQGMFNQTFQEMPTEPEDWWEED